MVNLNIQRSHYRVQSPLPSDERLLTPDHGMGLRLMSHMEKWMARSFACTLGFSGLALIIAGNAFSQQYLGIKLHHALANLGALLLITGILQFLYDRYFRKVLFQQLRSEMLGINRVADAGIFDYHDNSQNVNFAEQFLSSKNVVIGVNYSPKVIDNNIELVQKRMSQGGKITIAHVRPDTQAAQFLQHEYGGTPFIQRIEKLQQLINEQERHEELVTFVEVDTVFRYSFIQFDSRIWGGCWDQWSWSP